ncbi:MAG: MarR family transcriptional regulator, partial [Actinomyces sp.]|uniref:MarR family winged helix-turn-helix transcriptional regulator n=1 Tax=Actinomyces sp. TaxID=29317 RepID=UPI0026DC39DF
MDTIHVDIHERLRRLGQLLRRRRAEAHHHHGPLADTTRGRGRVLAALRMQSPIPTRELAFILDIRQQSLNELLKKLEADGLVERTPSREDRRVMLVSLTQAGSQAPLGQEGADPLSVLSQEEAQALAALLDKLIASLEEELGVDSDEVLEAWQQGARRRMGEERFEAIMRMREHGFAPDHGHRHDHVHDHCH